MNDILNELAVMELKFSPVGAAVGSVAGVVTVKAAEFGEGPEALPDRRRTYKVVALGKPVNV